MMKPTAETLVEDSMLQRGMNALARPAKVAGVAALSGLVGYATAKGIDTFLVPIHSAGVRNVYETAVVLSGAFLGGTVSSQAIAD
jgi:hypothetical protein